MVKELDLKSKTSGFDSHKLMGLVVFDDFKDTISNLINYWNSIVGGSNPLR